MLWNRKADDNFETIWPPIKAAKIVGPGRMRTGNPGRPLAGQPTADPTISDGSGKNGRSSSPPSATKNETVLPRRRSGRTTRSVLSGAEDRLSRRLAGPVSAQFPSVARSMRPVAWPTRDSAKGFSPCTAIKPARAVLLVAQYCYSASPSPRVDPTVLDPRPRRPGVARPLRPCRAAPVPPITAPALNLRLDVCLPLPLPAEVACRPHDVSCFSLPPSRTS